MRKLKVVMPAGCIIALMWVFCFLCSVGNCEFKSNLEKGCIASAWGETAKQMVKDFKAKVSRWPGVISVRKAAALSASGDLSVIEGTQEGGWLDDAEKGSKVDKDIEKNFFRRIWLTISSLIIISIILVVFVRVVYGKQGIIPNFAPREKMIKVLEKQMIQPQKTICLVDVAGKYLLLGVSENKIECLTEVEAEKVKEKLESIEVSQKAAGGSMPKLNSIDWNYIFPQNVISLYNRISSYGRKTKE